MLDKLTENPICYRPFSWKHLDRIHPLRPEVKTTIQTLAQVFPFKVNPYIVDELIDWDRVPDDPIFRLFFPVPDMLTGEEFDTLHRLVQGGTHGGEIREKVRAIQMRLNPHPAGQLELNVPKERGAVHQGLQHKYKETVLCFPSQGQTCMAYCAYCFRWAQFIGMDSLRFACGDPFRLVHYVNRHPEVTDVLFTGGDPLTMSAKLLARYIDPLLVERPGNLKNIRIGSKVPAQWPYRFLTDKDAADLLRLFERVVKAGYHLAIMAHYTHHRELETPAAEAAVRRIVSTGAAVRCQAPLVRHVNDGPEVWRRLWEKQVALGTVPYYMFVQRNTGPKDYFKVPLADAFRIFTEAYRSVSGLARTVRGPSMSATPGKVLIDGITEVGGEKVFVLKFLQGRNPSWVNKPFFARFDPGAAWLDELKPAFGDKTFFFDSETGQRNIPGSPGNRVAPVVEEGLHRSAI